MAATRDPAYPAARAAAPAVAAFFRRKLDEEAAHGALALAPAPDAATVEAMVDAAFWASLRSEEGAAPRISLAFLPPDGDHPLTFARPLPLEPERLTRLAPAVEHPGIHLGIWRGPDGLGVWGATAVIPNACFVVEVVRPGLLVIKHRRAEPTAKFGNVAVLEGDRLRFVDEGAASLPDCPALLESLLGFEAPAAWGSSTNVLVRLALAMRLHGRGGSLLVVPTDGDAWRESIVRPVSYPVAPPYRALASALARVRGGDLAGYGAMHEAVDTIAGLTAVDGATIVNTEYELLAFGAKIRGGPGGASVEHVTITEPVIGDAPQVIAPAEIGGTRHLSAAQFVHDQHDALALVASQDGRFTIFAWSPCEDMVHAHRVDVLLI